MKNVIVGGANRIKDIKEIAKGGFGTIYYAKWVDGYIRDWIIEYQRWKRKDGNSNDGSTSVRIYGITKDPETPENMIFQRWKNKLVHLKDLARKFSKIHKLDIVHRDYHPGNILKYNSSIPEVFIGKNIQRLLMFIVAYELITGISPYHDVIMGRIIIRTIIFFDNNNEIIIQIKEAKEFSKKQTTTTTPVNYKSHPQAIYTNRLLDFSNLPKPKNEEIFEKKT
ncbi:hypothetical protein Glove_97g79 [Diversispora epigaea]|uniref:Protein kinase domain-containing protein n=1 Tax=Diversispora epigaea TaxID=1348612 RepID=A0A397JDS4_9GLOM|nr:hypothetical protein Glove_97g79 [Diversispora epigaea]